MDKSIFKCTRSLATIRNSMGHPPGTCILACVLRWWKCVCAAEAVASAFLPKLKPLLCKEALSRSPVGPTVTAAGRGCVSEGSGVPRSVLEAWASPVVRRGGRPFADTDAQNMRVLSEEKLLLFKKEIEFPLLHLKICVVIKV